MTDGLSMIVNATLLEQLLTELNQSISVKV